MRGIGEFRKAQKEVLVYRRLSRPCTSPTGSYDELAQKPAHDFYKIKNIATDQNDHGNFIQGVVISTNDHVILVAHPLISNTTGYCFN